jgi:hypothetical protein
MHACKFRGHDSIPAGAPLIINRFQKQVSERIPQDRDSLRDGSASLWRVGN